MKEAFATIIKKELASLESFTGSNISTIVKQLNELQRKFITTLSKYLKMKPVYPKKKITIGNNVKDTLRVSFGLDRTVEEAVFASWLFNLQKKTRFYLLSFLLLKESLLVFLMQTPSEEEEAIINIISILLLVELYQIQSLENPLLSAIRSKICPETIGETNYLIWDNLLILLIAKKIPFREVFFTFKRLLREERTTRQQQTLVKEFIAWVNERTFNELDAISPSYLNHKLLELVENLLKFGYERSSTSHLAYVLKTSQKTITTRFRALNESFTTFWRSEINFEEMNLHNYFLQITLADKKHLTPLVDELFKNPYLQSIFTGSNSDSMIIYSPKLICPHIISERLHKQLKMLARKGLITDFKVNLIREKYRYYTLSERPITLTERTFKRLLKTEEPALRKYTFSHVKYRSNLSKERRRPVTLDPNLLFFLSIIKGKYLLRARYAVWINEFKKFYLKNNIPSTDIDAQTAFLYFNELRAKKKGLLRFYLHLRSLLKRAPDVLLIDLPLPDLFSEEQFRAVIQKLRVFAYMGEIILYDRHFFQILGLSHVHPLCKKIEQFLTMNGLSPTFYTIKLNKIKFLPLHELYNFEEQKWTIESMASLK